MRNFTKKAVLNLLLTGLWAMAGFVLQAQTTVTEGFEAGFPPTGWQLGGSNQSYLSAVASGTHATQTPHTGTGELMFNSYSLDDETPALLISPRINLMGLGASSDTFSFWLYRDADAYNTSTYDLEGVTVLFNTAPTATGATTLGYVPRRADGTPAVAGSGWYQYSFVLPSGYNGSTNYVILSFVSEFGDNIFLDDFQWNDYSLPCSGVPNPGNIVVGASALCPDYRTHLSLENPIYDANVSYQWQVSLDGSSWFDLTGATDPTVDTIVPFAVYARAVVTCNNGGASDTTLPAALDVQSPVCYCIPGSTSCDASDEITNVTFGGINNSSDCGTDGYTSYGLTATVTQTIPENISVYVENGGTENVSLWIDFDHSGTFDANEYYFIGSGQGGNAFTNTITVPATALTGLTGMRIRDRYSVALVDTEACSSDFSFGETEDYLVNILGAPTCTTPSVAGTASGPGAAGAGNIVTYTLSGSTGHVQWQLASTAVGPFSNISGANDSVLNYSFTATGTFYLRAFVMSPGCDPDSSNIISTDVVVYGDDVCDAIDLQFGHNGPYSTVPATIQTGEPVPPYDGCQAQDGWCDTILTNTLWFKFVAPASGRVRIQSPGFDTQLALWEASDCNALVTGGATFIAGNDDDPDYIDHNGAHWSSFIDSAVCLTPGKTYYVQLDPYSDPGDTTSIILTDLGAGPDAAFTGLQDAYCVSANAVTLTPTTSGGTFSGPGISGSSFDPSSAGVGGPYVITYSFYSCYYSTDTVTVTNGPVVNIDSVHNVSCNGLSDGEVFISVSGVAQPVTYTWSNSSTAQNLSGVAAGSYSLVVSDAAACAVTLSAINISEPDTLTALLDSLVDVKCKGDSTGGLYVTIIGGTTPYSYLWSDGQTTDDLVHVPAGFYSGTVTDAHGCVFSSPTIPISEPTDALAADIAQVVTPLCNGQTTGNIFVNTSGGTPPYTYLWSNGETVEDLTGIAAGSYSSTVTDNNGCVVLHTDVVVTQPDSILIAVDSIHQITCNSDMDGAIFTTISGGTGALSYLWSSGETTDDLTGLDGGDYSINVIDDNSCTATFGPVTIVDPEQLSATPDSLVNVGCNGDSTGGIYLTVFGGTMPYTYLWSDGSTTSNLTGVPEGLYSGTVTDAHGCTLASPTIPISQPDSLVAVLDSTFNARCNDGLDGAIYITVNGGTAPYNYAWNSGPTTEDITGGSGTYVVTITDSHGCQTGLSQITLTEPAAITVSVSAVNVSCHGDNTGAVTLSATGGTPNYTWSPANPAQNLTAGNYTYTLTDAAGCTVTASATISEPATALGASSIVTSQVQGGALGTITVTPSGGTPNYTYAWSNGATTQNLTDLNAGVYSGTITDANGCTFVVSDTVHLINGIISLNGGYTLSVYPNPANDKLFINVSSPQAVDFSAEIYTIGGQLVSSLQQQNVVNEKFDLNLSSVQAGVYFVKIKVADAIATERIVVTH